MSQYISVSNVDVLTSYVSKTMQRSKGGSSCLVILPKRSLLVNFASELRAILGPLNIIVEIISGMDSFGPMKGNCVRVTTPREVLDLLGREGPPALVYGLELVVCENMELLDAEYELSISLLMHGAQTAPLRFVGISDSVVDPSDLANWLHVPTQALCCFKPTDRGEDLRKVVKGFTIPHSSALFKAMMKHVHAAISSGAGEPVIIFVPSRSQCRTVANDLVTQCAMEMQMQAYLPSHMTAHDIEPYLLRLYDKSLVDLVSRGIGLFHDGLSKSDKLLMLELYSERIIRVLVVPRDSCWSLPLRAGVVIAMGTQYVRLEGDKNDRQVKDYPLADVFHMQGLAARHGKSGVFHLFCQSDSSETLNRFLDEGLPLESTLHETPVVRRWLRDRWKDGQSSDKQETMDILSWTYLAKRMASNPMYYSSDPNVLDESLSRIVDMLHA